MSKLIDKIDQWVEKYETNKETIERAINYLHRFGYLKSNPKETTVEDLVGAAKLFAGFFGLESSNDGLTPKIIRAMEGHRCGVPDILANRSGTAKWALDSDRTLTYFIEKRDSDLPASEWDNAIGEAFERWARVTNINFKKVNSKTSANLVISTGRGRKDDFDGSSGTLAWAYLPGVNYRGQLLSKFDEDETWITEIDSNRRGIILVAVACHEFGHMLGLDHSRIQSALMAPYYSPNVLKPQTRDDIPRIVNLYGEPVVRNEPSPAPDIPPSSPSDKFTIQVEGKITIPGYRILKI